MLALFGLAFRAGRFVFDLAHDDAAGERHGVKGDGEAFAVLVRPRCADVDPFRCLALAGDAIKALGGLRAFGGGCGHDLLLWFPPQGHLAASWGARCAGHRAAGHTPLLAPEGANLHKRWRAEGSGLNGGGHAPRIPIDEAADGFAVEPQGAMTATCGGPSANDRCAVEIHVTCSRENYLSKSARPGVLRAGRT